MAKKKETGTALVKWEEQFADLAKETSKGVVVSEGKFLSFKNGDLSFAGVDIPDNEIDIVVVGWMLHNTYYDPDIKYDAKNPTTPICYAYGRTPEEMEPHEQAPEKQCGSCEECPLNQFGSGKGNAKACKNGVRIAFIALDDLEDVAGSDVVYANIPPTSIKNWNSYVAKTLRDKHKRPHWSVVTRLSVTKEDDSVFKVHFEVAEDGILKDQKLFQPLQDKYNETMENMGTPYQEREAPKPSRGGKKPVSKPVAKPAGKKFSRG